MKLKRAISTIRFQIHNRSLFRFFIYILFFKRCKKPDKREKVKRNLYFNYKVNVDNPRSFNEYLLWIKKHYRNDLWCLCADKLKCKEFLIQNGFGDNVPKTLYVYKSSKDIDLSKLPERFTLKTNHDSGSVYVCDKSKTNFSKVFSKLDASLKHSYSKNTHEWFYDNIKPVIFAEETLTPRKNTANDLVDFKLFTFNGKYKFGYVGSNRAKDIRFGLFEDDFKYVNCEYCHLREPRKKMIKRPDSFPKMVDLSERIGSLFDFVRVDMYDTDKGIMVGELTFASMSGFGQFTKSKYDFKYGEFFKDTKLYELANQGLKK